MTGGASIPTPEEKLNKFDDKFIDEFHSLGKTNREIYSSTQGSYWTDIVDLDPAIYADLERKALHRPSMTEGPQDGDLSTCPCGTDHSLQAGPMPDGHT